MAGEPVANAATLQEALHGGRIPALDGVRAIAVMAVIMGHGGMGGPADLGVSAFFVLSGFLITWLLLKEWRRFGEVSLKDFYIRRTLRIFPAYYAFLAVSIGADTVLGDTRTQEAILPAVLYVLNYYNALNQHPPTSIAHAWSLGIEEQFYLLWPMLFIWASKGGLQRLGRVLVVLIVLAATWRSVGFLWLGISRFWAYNAFDMRLDNLAVGCLVAVLCSRDSFVRRASIQRSAPWIALALVLFLVPGRRMLGTSFRYSLGFTLEAVLLAALLLMLLQSTGSPLWKWLEWRWVRALGLISYPMYLYHQWGLAVGQEAEALPEVVQFLLGTLACVALATGSYLFVEKPFLKLKGRFSVVPSRPNRPEQAVGEP